MRLMQWVMAATFVCGLSVFTACRESHWDRYLGITAAMTQVPVPVTTRPASMPQANKRASGHRISKSIFLRLSLGLTAKWIQYVEPRFSWISSSSSQPFSSAVSIRMQA